MPINSGSKKFQLLRWSINSHSPDFFTSIPSKRLMVKITEKISRMPNKLNLCPPSKKRPGQIRTQGGRGVGSRSFFWRGIKCQTWLPSAENVFSNERKKPNVGLRVRKLAFSLTSNFSREPRPIKGERSLGSRPRKCKHIMQLRVVFFFQPPLPLFLRKNPNSEVGKRGPILEHTPFHLSFERGFSFWKFISIRQDRERHKST